jgi:hypothetical protein
MKPVLVLCWTILGLLLALPAHARTAYQNDAEIGNAARAAFEEILDLWRADRYDDLYERTTNHGRTAREDFARRLADAPHKPACCWQKLQDVSVQVESDDVAVVRAKVGLEDTGGTIYKTRSYRMVRRGDRWQLPQADIFALAGSAKKKGKQHRR